jgi:tRNA(Leu) C34 or U34 (ribose-2'-O)-methylase TrmL
MRGFAVIAADRPKSPCNFAGMMRAAHCYGADMLVLGGDRYKSAPPNVTKAERHIPLLRVAEVFDALPYGCVPVAVELVPDARPLTTYVHPERAFYVFGAEDATLGARILGRCRDVVYVPTSFCMNLAATVNVVLYDRMMKRMAKEVRA